MSFIVSRCSPTGEVEAKWVAASAENAKRAIVCDMVRTAPDLPSDSVATLTTAKNRVYVARALVAMFNPLDPPFPRTVELGGNIYRVEKEVSLNFPIDVYPDDNDTLLVTFPDVPGAVTFGEDEAEALVHAVDALETVLLARILDRQDIPSPSLPNGRPTVRPTLLGILKVMLYLAMRERGWRKADLARALDIDPRQVDRLLDLRHASTVRQLEQALAVCGKRADVFIHSLEAA